MDRKGFIDEINPAFLALALLGAFLGFFMTTRVETLGLFWKILTPIVIFVVVYVYLMMTDN